MKALSIRQPWAWLIAHGYKDIENRKWSTNYRGPLLIHAAKGLTKSEYKWVRLFVGLSIHKGEIPHIRLPEYEDLERGGFVGIATLTDSIISLKRTSVWHLPDQFGFKLENVKALPFTPYRGALSIFEVPHDICQQILGENYQEVYLAENPSTPYIANNFAGHKLAFETAPYDDLCGCVSTFLPAHLSEWRENPDRHRSMVKARLSNPNLPRSVCANCPICNGLGIKTKAVQS